MIEYLRKAKRWMDNTAIDIARNKALKNERGGVLALK